MATYEWRVAKNGTRRYVRIEAVSAPAPKGPQPVESDASIKVIPPEAPTVTAAVTPAPAPVTSPATVRPASSSTFTTTTRRRSRKSAAKKSNG